MNKMNKTKACLEITLEQARKWYENGMRVVMKT